MPWSFVASSITAGVFAGFITVSSCSGAGGDAIYMATFVGVCVFVAAFVLTAFRPLRLAWGTRVALDEGGLRMLRLGAWSYWPLHVVGSASIVKRPRLGGSALEVLDRTGRPIAVVPLFGARPRSQAMALSEAVAERVAVGTRELEGALRRLQRKGRLVEDWLRELAEEATRLEEQGPGFRGQALDTDALLEAVDDVRFTADDRAAAAFLLLSTRAPGFTERVRKGLNASSPPLLAAVCAVAAPDERIVPPELIVDALSYLDEDDQAAINTALV